MRGITGGRGILGGAVLLAVGFGVLMQALGAADAGAYLFLFLGLAFALAYVAGTHQFVYLVPGATMTGFGLGLIIPTAFGLQDQASGVFLGSLAIAFLVVYLLSPSRKIPLAVAAVVGVVALADIFTTIPIIPDGLKPYFVPIILIVTGAYLILEPRTH
ncbi:MAG TPA: hypothetical protein DCK98_17240 [Chloroflexi bacterium]|jgi:hypothetical protein|nr:hypothetical protein [Chloroflexota bacterium]HAL26790.1 hypothetical protein [Chloroflexota bacterium]